MITQEEQAREHLATIAKHGSTRTHTTTGRVSGEALLWTWDRFGRLSCASALLCGPGGPMVR